MPAVDLAEPLSPLQIFFGLRGRIPRRTFWLYGIVVPILLGAYLHALLGIAGVHAHALEGGLNAVLLWSALAVSAKRWHDRDKSGWWVLLQLIGTLWALLRFVPLIGTLSTLLQFVPAVGTVIGTLWTLIENGLLRGTPGPNRFGPDVTESL